MAKDFSGLAESLDIAGDQRGNPIEEDVRINPADLEYEFESHPEKYAWWAFLAEHAKADVEMLKNNIAILYAQLDFAVRDKARQEEETATSAKRKPIKYTEKMVESEVITNKEYREAQTRLLNSKKMAGLAAAGRAAMDHRRDMLLQIGANYRVEGQADPVILKEAAKEKARERAQRKHEQAQAKKSEKIPPGKAPPTKRPPGKRPPG
jgi:hypothetical protein